MASLGMTLIPALGLSYQCPVQSSPFSFGGGLSTGAMAILASSMSAPTSVQGMIDNISVAPSTSWYFALTPFESIMLGIIVLKVINGTLKSCNTTLGKFVTLQNLCLMNQLFLLRYLTILPINFNDLSNKDYFKLTNQKRRRRELDNPKIVKEKQRLAETMFTV